MSYPLIIVGAGASHDYLNQNNLPASFKDNNQAKWRSPLMNSLFDNTRFDDVISRHGSIGSLVSEISGKLSYNLANEDKKEHKHNFETILTDLKNNKANKNASIRSQLVSLVYYLADLFHEISNSYYHRINNYKLILQQIDHDFQGKACFVSFNYDLILERSIEEHYRISFGKLNDYISNTSNVKVIKLHGSCNWRYNPIIVKGSKEEFPTSESYLINHPEIAFDENVLGDIYPTFSTAEEAHVFNVSFNENLHGFTAWLPALALPLQDKNNFVCPKSHIDILESCLKEISKVLIIGWGAADPFLLEELNKHISADVPIAIACGSNSKEYVMPNLGEKLSKQVTTIGDKFSDFVNSGLFERFLTKT